MTAAAKEACSNCRYYRTLNALEGECRHDAPKPGSVALPPGQLVQLPRLVAVWPVVKADSYCGRWTPLPLVQQPLEPGQSKGS